MLVIGCAYFILLFTFCCERMRHEGRLMPFQQRFYLGTHGLGQLLPVSLADEIRLLGDEDELVAVHHVVRVLAAYHRVL